MLLAFNAFFMRYCQQNRSTCLKTDNLKMLVDLPWKGGRNLQKPLVLDHYC